MTKIARTFNGELLYYRVIQLAVLGFPIPGQYLQSLLASTILSQYFYAILVIYKITVKQLARALSFYRAESPFLSNTISTRNGTWSFWWPFWPRCHPSLRFCWRWLHRSVRHFFRSLRSINVARFIRWLVNKVIGSPSVRKRWCGRSNVWCRCGRACLWLLKF